MTPCDMSRPLSFGITKGMWSCEARYQCVVCVEWRMSSTPYSRSVPSCQPGRPARTWLSYHRELVCREIEHMPGSDMR